MRVWQITGIVFIGLIIMFVLGFVILSRAVDLEHFKSQITRQIRDILKREVTIDDLRFKFSFDRGVALEIENFSVADDPGFSSQSFLNVPTINLEVDAMALLKEQRLVVNGIFIHSPEIVLIRDKEGRLNLSTLGFSTSAEVFPDFHPQNSSPSPISSENIPFPDGVWVKFLRFENGRVRLINRSVQPELSVELSDVTLKADGFSLTESFLFEIRASLLSADHNITFNGTAQAESPQKFRVRNVDGAVDFSKMSTEQWRSSQVGKMIKIESGGGRLFVTIEQALIDRQGIKKFSAHGRVMNGSLKMAPFVLPANQIFATWQATEAVFNLQEFSSNWGKGIIRGRGKIEDYAGAQNYTFSMDALNLSLEEIVAQENCPIHLSGIFSGTFKARGKGFTKESLKESLWAGGSLRFSEGRLHDFNLLHDVLDKISFVPDLVPQIEQSLPEKYREALKRRDTVILTMEMSLGIRDQSLALDSFQMEGEGFAMTAKGHLDVQRKLYLDAAMHIPYELSSQMVAAEGDLKYLLNNYQQIFLPLQEYDGPVKDFRLFPDLEYLGRKIAVGRSESKPLSAAAKVLVP